MSLTPTILIADRDPEGLASCSDKLDLSFNCTIEHVFTEEELHASLINAAVAVLIVDFNFSEACEDLSLFHSVKANHPDILIMPIIPASQPHLLKPALELDLFYFIHKPIDPIESSIALQRAFESLPSAKSTKAKKNKPKYTPYHGIIGSSNVMRRLFELITRVAEDDISTVLIRGESGTGKEMVAKAIHAESRRRDKNFVPVNCAAIPDDLLESELFGYTKGAFTGATANKPGRIQYADQGTLFLDEIGDMKASLQAKLLRVLQEKEFEPVGAFKAIPINTRILAATHCDLETLVSEGKFREDLYYRLSVVPLNIPPLNGRAEDIPLLIDAFLEKYAENRGRERFVFSATAMAAIRHYEWRGNVRELENLIQHMCILYSGKQVQLSDLPEKFHNIDIPENAIPDKSMESIDPEQPPSNVSEPPSQQVSWENGQVDFKELINDFETQLIVQALKQTEGNKKEAARLLNLKRTTLLEKIKKKDIEGLWKNNKGET